MRSRRYVIQVRTTETPAAFREFIDNAREAGVIASYEDGSGAQLTVSEIEGTEVAAGGGEQETGT